MGLGLRRYRKSLYKLLPSGLLTHPCQINIFFVIIRRSGLGVDFYIKPDFLFLIYGYGDLKWVFGPLKTDLTFLSIRYLIWALDLGVVLTCPILNWNSVKWDSVRHIIYYL